ncbi:DUF488 domain-containing protein [Sporosarcina sp. Marseille-Q4063]|uniref:DUF488 domain-containing protein n=1 Tax=Sporosarcina sp. Marseille-Q4063 TaxID=2810514 RepID=UPI001BAF6DB0|nr:DUF488 domain-containing protein [Sporosarcina sp. Marseille-Q4063]QUW22645.1 DUF488 domain-containing protein [Sporosarcina sp. Marseille-Q4063]
MDIFTVGHSTHTEEEFLQLLQDGDIDFLVDVRAFPGSRKFPHFHKDRMSIWLPESGIDYSHIKELGGRRNKSKTIDNEINDAWENRSFHNYADYTLEEDFQTGLEKLKEIAENNTVAYCCSERHPARCHRLLISNWLSLNGWTVRHILDGPKGSTKIEDHVPGQWGAPPVLNNDGTVIYPK